MLNKSKGIILRLVLGILVASLFVPVFVATDPKSVAAAPDCTDLYIGLAANPGIYAPGTDTVGITGSKVLVSKSTVTKTEEFNIYMEISLTPELAAACESSGMQYQFDLRLSAFKLETNTSMADTSGKIFTAAFVKGQNKLAANFTVTLESLGLNGVTPCNWACTPLAEWLAAHARDSFISTYYIYGYLKSTKGISGYSLGPKISFAKYVTVVTDGAPHPVDPSFPADIAPTTGIEAGVNGILYDALTFRVGMDGAGLDADKYRHFFRVTFADGGWVAMGKAAATTSTPTTYDNLSPPRSINKFSLLKALLISPFAIQEARAQNTTNPATSPATSTSTSSTPSTYDTTLVSLSTLKIPLWMSSEATGGIAWGSGTATKINYSTAAQLVSAVDKDFASNAHPLTDLAVIAIETKKSADPKVCGPLKLNKQQIACSKSGVSYILPEAKDGILTKDHKKFPFSADATQLKQLGVKDATDKTPVLSDVYLAPTIQVNYTWKDLAALFTPVAGFSAGSIIGSYYGFSYTADAQHLFFEVYSSKAELEAHKNDAPPAGVTPYSETVTSSSTASSNTAQDLFNFLRKVISYIVLLMTSIVYWIFSVILVPVLNALLKIRPYQDQFVNFIYPGWIIMRNLANIGFILALLWMGLRTLFQAEDSSKTRGFILWLVLMALLVNFSLVIAQGVVGIADTVQSQFLPADSKVIEALGQKLMVDPIKFFRGQSSTSEAGGVVANITESNNFTVNSSAADITKPIVLLILAIAAFFSFVALIGFIIVRLVALWILYMLSPLAYVAKILPETKQYWDTWWKEFIKYAFTVPVLAFFLNIAALMATTFAKRSGDSVIAGRDPSYLFSGLAGNFIEYGMTVMSHFIVLFFIYAGMMFALKSGTFGAKQIVDGAKKGFDFVTKTVPAAAGRGALAAGRWAKDSGADALANSKMLKGRPGLQKAIMGVARPIQAGKAIKKGYFDNPKEEMNKRFTDQFGKLTDKIQPWGENKLFPAKMAWWKATGQDSKTLMTQAEKKKEFAEIRNDSDMGELATKLSTNERYLNALNTGTGRADLGMARENLSDLQGKLNAAEAADAENSTAGSQRKVARLRHDENQLRTGIGIAEANGDTDIDVSDMGTDFNLNLDATKAKLQADISDATLVLNDDNAKRSALGFTGTMDDERRKTIMKEVSDDATLAQSRERPFSKALADKEESEAREKQKGLGDLDYDQLENGFNKALAENNVAAARAHFKQMADNGVLDKLLKSNKKADGSTYKNNVEDLAGFVKAKFGNTSGKSQINIIREVSNSSEKNGNTSLSNAVKSLGGGGGILNTISQQQQVLENKKVKDVTDWKKGDVTHKDNAGIEQFNSKIKEKLRSYDTKEKSKGLRQKIDRGIADHILEKFNNDPRQVNSIGNHVASALVDAASPNIANRFKPHIVV